MSDSIKKMSRRKKVAVWLGVIGLVVILSIGGYAGYLYLKVGNLVGTIGTDEEVPKGESAVEKPKTLLMLGTDYRQETRSMNTDVIIVATMNPKTKRATMVSIPRDTYLQPAGFTAGKANSYYARLKNSGDPNVEKQVKSIYSEYIGVPIDYVVVFNFQAFSDIIDELGGVFVNVDMDMKYVDHQDGTNINLLAGPQTLNGKQALDYVRYRQSNMGTASSSDFERNARQQQVIAAMLDKFKSIGGVFSLGGVLESLGKNITSDIPSSEIRAMMKTYAGINRSNIEFVHLEGQWQSPYVYIAEADVQKATQSLSKHLQK